MPVERKKIVSTEDLRHAEYYDMQGVYDDLYARSKAGEHFTDLLSIVLSRNNILLAYRNIKANTGSNTAGTDKLTIKDIGEMPVDEWWKGKIHCHWQQAWLPPQTCTKKRHP